VAPEENRSEALFQRAIRVLPGGVSRNTIFRRPHPSYVKSGNGCRVTDVEGIERIDFSNNMASLIHGHAYPPVVKAVSQQLQGGTAFTLATEAEVRFAELLVDRVPGFDQIRFVNSGTEAVMAALKAARAYTGKPKIAKVEGAYHGGYDYAEVSQTASPENWGVLDEPTSVPVAVGTPKAALDDVVIIPFNDAQRATRILDRYADSLACVLMDPIPHRVGLIPADNDFVNALYNWTREHEALLIFDEVITFRTELAGAQQLYDAVPDLTALGKMIGGGFPVGALAGSRQVMKVLDPTEPRVLLPHSGTFSANPVTMTAGRVAMEHFDSQAVSRLNELGSYARARITELIDQLGIEACVTGAGSMFRVHLREVAPVSYREGFADAQQRRKIAFLVEHLFESGFIMVNTCSGMLSTAMTRAEIDQFTEGLKSALEALPTT
jgi:glutamate-1-semialdehyde 2,1-aminomutase